MSTKIERVTVIGAGLAGSEAAWQLAKRDVCVRIIEMRPNTMTPAHSTGEFAELVCSNSLGSLSTGNAAGILKTEMRMLDSLILKVADLSSIPAGGALAVDRTEFSTKITEVLSSLPNITIEKREVTELSDFSDEVVIVATGPLTSPSLTDAIMELTGSSGLHFYDAAAPVLTLESVDLSKAFWASRYEETSADYLNCPMDEEEYTRFYHALVTAERAPLHDFEKPQFFEGCMPVEQMADRGEDTIRFGPLKPVGLVDPRTGRQPYAVVQLRRDNRAGTLLNMVGFQTRLKWNEQVRVFRLIPGLENVEFVRLGVIHRNTYLNSPQVLLPTYQCKQLSNLYFAGQLTGVEGYMESAASGLVAGINASLSLLGQEPKVFPEETLLGALAHYITSADPSRFQPMNANIGILPPLGHKVKGKKQRNEQMGLRSTEALTKFFDTN